MTIIEIGYAHPVIDAIAKNIASVSSHDDPSSTYAAQAAQVACISDLYEKQVTSQRALALNRLRTICAYQKSVKEGSEIKLDPETVAFCDALGVEDWRDCPMNDLLSFSKEQLKKAKFEWIRAKIYCLIIEGELLTELKRADVESIILTELADHAGDTQ